jgi:5'-nucleotidase
MNLLSPDIASLGNHEVDYGLAHLLFLERCAKFPIVNANLFIKNPYTRLFKPYKILKAGGMKVLFIGIVTQEVMSSIRQDSLLGGLVDVEDAAREVGRICNAYRTVDIDFTVLLTHIGFEEDKRLAALLDPAWGVDVIVGGHSHTILEQPARVNDILIAQAGVGTKQIGHFDIVVDTDLNQVHSFEWRLVPIDSRHCPRDTQLENTIARFQREVDEKYDRMLCRFPRPLTHPDRYRETELGNLVSDALRDSLGADLVLCGSGSIRKTQAGPVLTRGGLRELMPFDDRLFVLKASGAQLRRMLAHVLRGEILDGGHGEFYQFSRDFRVTYDRGRQRVERLEFGGRPLEDGRVLRVGLQEYHYRNFEEFFGLPPAALEDGKGTVAATSLRDVLEEYFAAAREPDARGEGRLVIQ